MSNTLGDPAASNRAIKNFCHKAIATLKQIDPSTPNIWPSPPRDPVALSKRHTWKQAHGITTVYHPLRDPGFDWIARLSLSQVRAATEDEAERAIAEKHNIAHWSQPDDRTNQKLQ